MTGGLTNVLSRLRNTGKDAASVGAPDLGTADPPAITVERDLSAIEDAWRSFETRAVCHAFQAYDFAEPWLRLVGPQHGAEPLILFGRDSHGDVLFILPLAVVHRLGRRAVEWIGGAIADYGCGAFAADYLEQLANDPQRTEAFRQAVFGVLQTEADLINLARQPVKIGDYPNPLPDNRRIRNSDSAHHTRLGNDWQTYYRAKRNSDSRRTDRSKFRRLAVLGEVRAFDATTAADIDRVMDALFAQKQRQLKRMGIRDMFADDAVRAFYRELAHNRYSDACRPRGTSVGLSHVAALEINGHILAANWGLVRNDRYYYVMHSYDESMAGARFSPGRRLMYHLMKWCIDHDIGLFDFTIGDESFKAQWCETSHPLYDSVVPVGLRALDMSMSLRAGKPVKRFIKTHDHLRTAALRLRRSLARG